MYPLFHVACRSQCSILSQESPVTSFRDLSPYFQGLTMSTVAYAEMIESQQSSDQRLAAVQICARCGPSGSASAHGVDMDRLAPDTGDDQEAPEKRHEIMCVSSISANSSCTHHVCVWVHIPN